MKPPKTNYTKVGDSLVAYQVVGQGPIDLVYSSGMAAMEALWEHPIPARFLEDLASFTRLIMFDPRGWGASDRFGPDRSNARPKANRYNPATKIDCPRSCGCLSRNT